MNDNGLSGGFDMRQIQHSRSQQRLRDWRYFVDFMFSTCGTRLAYVVTRVDEVTENGDNVHSVEMWGLYRQ